MLCQDRGKRSTGRGIQGKLCLFFVVQLCLRFRMYSSFTAIGFPGCFFVFNDSFLFLFVIFQFFVIRFTFLFHFYWFVSVFSWFWLTAGATLRRMTHVTLSIERLNITSQVLRETAGRLRDSARQKELGLAITEARWGNYQGNSPEVTSCCLLRVCFPIVRDKKKRVWWHSDVSLASARALSVYYRLLDESIRHGGKG